jgi:hypothetical protein
VVVTLPGKRIVVAPGCDFEMPANVLDPEILSAPAPPWSRVAAYVEPPPTNVLAETLVIEITPFAVPAVVVKLVGDALLNAVAPEVETNNVEPLNVRFFVPAAVTKLGQVQA